jgi:hypothetical protein
MAAKEVRFSGGLLLGFDALDDDAIVKWTEFHDLPPDLDVVRARPFSSWLVTTRRTVRVMGSLPR